MRFFLKVLISGLIIAGVSTLARRSGLLAAVLASLPLTSILALTWVYQDTHDMGQVASLSMGIFWAVVPSLVFFILFAWTARAGLRFSGAMLISCAGTAVAYFGYGLLMKKLGVL